MWVLFLITMASVPPGRITSDGATVAAAEMMSVLMEHQVVFIGEQHDDPLAHQWELYIWEALAEDGRALALEMFETDVQGLLDSYLAGEVTEEEFLEGSRPWGNYTTDYAPLVELARERGLPVIAANVPRRYAAMVASGGWQAISAEPFFQELQVDSSSTFYRNAFMETMEAVGDQMHGMPMSMDDLYRAQLLKDAVMASSIEGLRCVFVCGGFHSDHHSGIPDQMGEGADFITVRILPEGEPLDPEAADYVIIR